MPEQSQPRGDLAGRFLGFAHGGPGIDQLAGLFGAISMDVWLGKTFRPDGKGYNRILRDTGAIAPFDTKLGPSRTGTGDALHLEYAFPFSQLIKDEIREVAPGVYLGVAYARVNPLKEEYVPAFYFGLQAPTANASSNSARLMRRQLRYGTAMPLVTAGRALMMSYQRLTLGKSARLTVCHSWRAAHGKIAMSAMV